MRRSCFRGLAGRACWAVAIVAVLTTVGLSFGGVDAAPASASGMPPKINWTDWPGAIDNRSPYPGYGESLFVYSTKMAAEVSIDPEALTTKWRAEYSTSKSALESGAGIVTNSGEIKIEAGKDEAGHAHFAPYEVTYFGHGCICAPSSSCARHSLLCEVCR